MKSQQKSFESVYEGQMDFTPGDLLENTYKDSVTEQCWRIWKDCWMVNNRRWQKKLGTAMKAVSMMTT